MRDDRQRLLDILEAVERVERYSSRGRADFENEELIQTWVLHHLEIIGEACRGLSPGLMSDHAEVEWSKVIGMRNILVHHYFGIDPDAVWLAAVRDLPALAGQVRAILAALDS